MAISVPLAKLAQQLAEEITAYDALDFEIVPASELIVRAWGFGYRGIVVQELTAVNDRSPCKVVGEWNEALGSSDVYRRPEALDLGVGYGVVGDSLLTVLVVGVPAPADPDKKRWPGIAPREYAVSDMFRDVNRRRFGLGLPSFERDEDFDAQAQRLADEILADPKRRYGGSLSVSGGGATALYYKGEGPYVQTDGFAITEWFRVHRELVAAKDSPRAGGGLASRGRDGRLEGVWVLVVGPPSR